MILPDFEYLVPKSAEEACRLLKTYGGRAKLMAGGTDLINFMKAKTIVPDYVIDIKEIPGMNQITYDPADGLTIGALAKLRDIELSPLVQEHYPVIAEAVHLIASTQIRSKGTLAGNICNASPSADSVPALFVLDAQLVVQGTDGQRTIPINDFYTGFKRTALKADEMVTAIKIPCVSDHERCAYLAHTVRKAMDLAIVGTAVKLTMDENGICRDARVALGAVAVTCVRSPKAEAVLIGQKITPELAEAAGKMAMEDCSPITDVRASAEYRHDMVRVFTRRTILKCLERFSGGIQK